MFIILGSSSSSLSSSGWFILQDFMSIHTFFLSKLSLVTLFYVSVFVLYPDYFKFNFYA